MNNIKAKHYIEYTKDGITDKFHEGDKVICRTAYEEYTGTLVLESSKRMKKQSQ